MKSYFCALIPDQKTKTLIQHLKDEAYVLSGWQQFIAHFPHSTLFVGDYKGLEAISLPDTLLAEIKSLDLSTQGWHTFLKDPVTGKVTLTITLDEESNQKIRGIQKKVLELCGKYNTGVIVERYRAQMGNFPQPLRENTLQYGFPFVGDIWKGHLTIASFDGDKYDEVWNRLKDTEIRFGFNIEKIGFYTDDDHDHLEPIKEFPVN